jgi:hypothetical protein
LGAGEGNESISFRAPASVGADQVTLLTIPLAGRVRITNQLSFEVLSAWAAGRLVRPDATESTIDGPTDTEARLTLGLGNGLITLTGIAQLPTGRELLTLEQGDLAGFIASDVFPFRVSNWGTGGGAGVSASLARAMGDFAGGITVGYVVAREFEPLEESPAYRPGNQFSMRAALDRTFGNAGKLSLSFSVQHYEEDKSAEVNLFQAGRRYQGLGSYAFAVGGSGAGIVYAGYLRRGAGEFFAPQRFLPVQALFFTGAGLEFHTVLGILRPAADLRVLRRDDGVAQGHTVSAGADLEKVFARFAIIPTARARFGNVLLRADAESGFSGFDVGHTLRFGAVGR